MKKILYPLLGLGCMLATSCDMDLEPVGSISDEQAMQTANDAFAFRNGFYNNLRALSTGGYIYLTELQMDGFFGIISNGNVNGPINNGEILSSDSDIEGIWGGLYGAIANTNFFFEHVQALLDGETIESVEDIQAINRYIGEAHFMRAYFYYWLLDHYCPAYSNATKDQLLGLPIVTVYNPTASKDGYPGRSTLAETYKFIEDDLAAAYTAIKEWEDLPDVEGSDIKHKADITPMSNYLCSWTVRALQARLALLKGDYQTAADYAKEVIDSRVYRLATNSNYAAMWTNDTNNELILRPTSTTSELGIGSTGGGWIGSSTYTAYYIPVPDLCISGPLGLYEDDDVRFKTFVKESKLQINGAILNTPTFQKYPGNKSLNTSDANSVLNMAKPFRLSEMYLIWAEASYELGNTGDANDAIETLRKNRFKKAPDYTDLTGTQLRDLIRTERHRELLGEGFRMSDLRRWQQGFSRTDANYTNYPGVANIVTVAGRNVVYQDNDHRYTWPIPAAEIQVNPQLAGQQNPGY